MGRSYQEKQVFTQIQGGSLGRRGRGPFDDIITELALDNNINNTKGIKTPSLSLEQIHKSDLPDLRRHPVHLCKLTAQDNCAMAMTGASVTDPIIHSTICDERIGLWLQILFIVRLVSMAS